MPFTSPSAQLIALFVLALPIASVTWAITHEELFRELHEYCVKRSGTCQRIYQRKFFFALTCEFCLSHYVTIAFLILTRYKLLFDSWQGYLIAWFSLVWIANIYMAIFGRLRLEIKSQRLEIEHEEKQLAASPGKNASRTKEDRYLRETA